MRRLALELEGLRAEAAKRETAITALQACCAHQWAEDGHDSRHDYRRCVLCGLRERGREVA